jgi:hypothetical protein
MIKPSVCSATKTMGLKKNKDYIFVTIVSPGTGIEILVTYI